MKLPRFSLRTLLIATLCCGALGMLVLRWQRPVWELTYRLDHAGDTIARISPDDRWLVVLHKTPIRFATFESQRNFHEGISIYDARDGSRICFVKTTASDFAFGADNRTVVTLDRKIQTWSLPQGEKLREVDRPFDFRQSRLTRTGNAVAGVVGGQAVAVLTAETGAQWRMAEVHGVGFGDYSLSPDGRWLVTSAHDYSNQRPYIKVLSIATGQLVCSIDHLKGYDRHPFFSPDSRHIVISEAGFVDIYDATSGGFVKRRAAQIADWVDAGSQTADGRALYGLFFDVVRSAGSPSEPETLHDFGGKEVDCKATNGQFARSGTRIVGSGPSDTGMSVLVFDRTKPEEWSIFHLWEFWLTALLCAIVLASFLRDRRAKNLSPQSPPTARTPVA